MSRMKDSTTKYLEENEYVDGLPRVVLALPDIKSGWRHRIPKFIKEPLRCVLLIYRFIREVFTAHVWYVGLFRLKGFGQGKNALVIGNGPSQGLLDLELVQKFKEDGGEIFVVNFWNVNEKLSSCIPDFIVISDPATLAPDGGFPSVRDKNRILKEYIEKNKDIKLICPLSRCSELSIFFGSERIFGFSDIELNLFSKNIKPIFPRAYLSMTLYKAIAVALWFNYEKIYVIGMDNTYPRDIYCDINNRILSLERHAGVSDYVLDVTESDGSISNRLADLSRLFRDASLLRGDGKVINLDKYSLTDAFPKIDIANRFFWKEN